MAPTSLGKHRHDLRYAGGNSADSPAPRLGPSPPTGQGVELFAVEDADLGYDAERFPCKQPQRG
jgi:hypothetical protein